MIRRLIRSTLALALIFQLSCGSREAVNSSEYVASIKEWQQLRIDSLKGVTGYLNLAGLFWLETGSNTIGSDSLNKFIFPKKAPAIIGDIQIAGDSIWLLNKAEEVLVSGGINADSILIYTLELPRVSMQAGDLHWYIIKRGSEYGIRLKDYAHPLLKSFNNIDNYPIEAKWRVEAKFEKYPEPKIVIIKNQVGMDLETPVFGQFHFSLDGTEYSLEPVSPLDSESYFTMIYDRTSGESTYGSGRYIDVPKPDENGIAYIDFNKAYNPPCAFTEFATCTFPHAANRLDLKIEAGEKYKSQY